MKEETQSYSKSYNSFPMNIFTCISILTGFLHEIAGIYVCMHYLGLLKLFYNLILALCIDLKNDLSRFLMNTLVTKY